MDSLDVIENLKTVNCPVGCDDCFAYDHGKCKALTIPDGWTEERFLKDFKERGCPFYKPLDEWVKAFGSLYTDMESMGRLDLCKRYVIRKKRKIPSWVDLTRA